MIDLEGKGANKKGIKIALASNYSSFTDFYIPIDAVYVQKRKKKYFIYFETSLGVLGVTE